MPDYSPKVSSGPRALLRLRVDPDVMPNGERTGWDAQHRMWIDTPVRRRSYICSRGVEHRRYWRLFYRHGDDFACEHEVELLPYR
jgi:hypothetical protein